MRLYAICASLVSSRLPTLASDVHSWEEAEPCWKCLSLGATFHLHQLSVRPKGIKSLDWRSLSLRRFLRAALKRFHLAEPLINLRLLDAAAFSAATAAAHFHGNEKLKVSSPSALAADTEIASVTRRWKSGVLSFALAGPRQTDVSQQPAEGALSDAICLICCFLPSHTFKQRF